MEKKANFSLEVLQAPKVGNLNQHWTVVEGRVVVMGEKRGGKGDGKERGEKKEVKKKEVGEEGIGRKGSGKEEVGGGKKKRRWWEVARRRGGGGRWQEEVDGWS